MTTAKEIALGAMKQGGDEIPVQERACQIDITNEDEAARQISDAVNNEIPGLFSRNGDVVQVCEVTSGNGPKLIIPSVDADSLRMLLAHHAYCYRVKMAKNKAGELVPVPTSGLPSVSTTRAVLTQTNWPGLRSLTGVVSMPIIRPDGTILTTRGYDLATGLYYRPAYRIPDVPDRPTPDQVAQAKRFVFEHVLVDFLWDGNASRANYFGVLLTPLLRLFIGGPAPFSLISAATRGSGKSLLTEILKALYGMKMNPWVRKDEEMSKTITSILKDTTEPVVCFDNIDPFDTVNQPSLAMLMTSTDWSARILGASSMFTGVNDRLWCGTGNNISVGGDMASRSVLTRLDPQMERPEERTGFAIPNLWAWLTDETNRGRLLWCLLVLVRSWVADGAHRDTSIAMRNFSAWGQVLGGLAKYHEVPDFLGNQAELTTVSDDEETSTAAFILRWYSKFNSNPKRAIELIDSTRVDSFGGRWNDPWDGTFPTKPDGTLFSVKGMGRFLAARRDRIFAGHVLKGTQDGKSKVWFYRVMPIEDQS